MVEKAAKGLPAPQGEGFGGGVCNVCYQPRFLNTDPTLPLPYMGGELISLPSGRFGGGSYSGRFGGG